jgi:bla regulator protein BlaR1
MPNVGSGRNRAIDLIAIVLGSCQLALCQSGPPARPTDQQSPSYEVATVKPSDGKGYAVPLRVYIQAAFASQRLASDQIIGPDWINKKSYDIEGKVPESLHEAMSKMTREERMAQTQLMMQSLLADRFKLKYHFETRELQAYKLVVAKGGLRVKEHPDRTKAGVWMNRTDQGGILYGAATIPDLVGLLTNVQEIGAKPIINETGLAGTFYDFSLKWSSSAAADPANNAGIPSNADAPSIFTAVQEQLGLKLVAAKAPVKVVVIDHIEPPTPN